jgi:hypothetical protein
MTVKEATQNGFSIHKSHRYATTAYEREAWFASAYINGSYIFHEISDPENIDPKNSGERTWSTLNPV